MGNTIDKDMIAVPIGPSLHMAVVASPDDFAAHPRPRSPADPTGHQCINQRVPTSGGLYEWDLEKCGRKINVRVDGPLIFNTSPPPVDAALAGLGIFFLPEDEVVAHMEGAALCGCCRTGAQSSQATTSTIRASASQ